MRPLLIVDDDVTYRTYLLDALARDGINALVAASGRAALALLETRSIAGMVTDILMPDMDGIELVRAVRRTHSSLPILALSAHGQDVADVYLKAASAVGATLIGRKGPGDIALLRSLLDIVDFRHHTQRRVTGQ